MPCRDDWVENEWRLAAAKENQKKMDKLTSMLCEAMSNLSDDAAVSGELTEWWRNHREQDRKRQEAEDEKRTLKKIAGDALRKLNVEDMEALKFIGVTFPSNMKKALKS